MINSHDIDLLRPDVAVNCRALIRLCAERGLPVLVTSTVRDDEYQAYLYEQGRSRPGSIVTNGKRPTFHWTEAGLAFDICKNVKGQEYSNSAFFREVALLGKEMGFTWGGDWVSISDLPHFQWDDGGRYTNAMIRSGKLPPQMPPYEAEEEETMTQEQFNQMAGAYFASLAEQEPAAWSKEARDWAEKNGILQGDSGGKKQYRSFCTREQMVVFLKRFAEQMKK